MSDQPERGRDEAPPRDRRESARRLAVAILGVLAILFAVLNLDQVKVDLLADSVRMPLVVVIGGCLLIGGLIGWFAGRRGRDR